MSAKPKSDAEEPENPFMDNMFKIMEMYPDVLSHYMKIAKESGESGSMPDYSDMFKNIFTKITENPDNLYQKQIELYTDYAKIWGNTLARYMGEETKPFVSPNPSDKRFRDKAWDEDMVFDFLKQSYLLTSDWAIKFIRDIKGIDKKTEEKFEFFTKQYIDAMSPSNFAFTNPEVIRETINSKGENLVKGLKNLMEDLENSKQFLNISTTNKNAFKLGENIAATPGKVVFKNDLIELLQYTPTTKNTYEVPVLIMPAWINKYYILDLSEHNSFVRWLVNQGYTVFMISWINPDEKMAHKKFEDYMQEGPIDAIDQILKITGQKQVNAIGYCLGGTLLACTLSYLKAKKQDVIKSATFLTTMLDFSNVGDMSVFIDEGQLQRLEEQMKKHGFLDGSEMAAIFSMMRSNDLIWSFVVNNYLLGREPFPFDILYWNADSTRLPLDTHSFYLRNMYLLNNLVKPGEIVLKDVPINLSRIDLPCYFLSAIDDHIAPWETTYNSMLALGGRDKTFVLSGSGHVAGVVNPPDKNKYYFLKNAKRSDIAKEWANKADKNNGSWWPDFDKWLSVKSGEKKAALTPKGKENAPGDYVKG